MEAKKKPISHDEYLASASDAQRPILAKVRKVVHKACPQVEESIKWGNPHFEHEGMLVALAGFKEHVSLSFWRGAQLADPEGLLATVGNTAMAGMRLEEISDLPSERVLIQYIREAMRLNEAARAAPRKRAVKAVKKPPAKAPTAPADLLAALRKSKKALATFEGFSPTNKKDYVEWVTEAKREATREKRVAQAVEWMAAGKPRNWKYMKEWAGRS